jgi:hypothetical protein
MIKRFSRRAFSTVSTAGCDHFTPSLYSAHGLGVFPSQHGGGDFSSWGADAARSSNASRAAGFNMGNFS